jgi:hypothetical protein
MPAAAVGRSGSFRGALAVSTVLGAFLTSCAVRPSELPVGLSIVPDVSSLHIGESAQMTVIQRYADGTSKEVPFNLNMTS